MKATVLARLARRGLILLALVASACAAPSGAVRSADPPSPPASLASPAPSPGRAAPPAPTFAPSSTNMPPAPTASRSDPTATTIPSGPTATASALSFRSDGRLVLAYYVPYDSTSWASLQAHADQIDLVATQTVSLSPCGDLATQDDLTLLGFARARHLRVVPSLFTSDQTLNHRILADPSVAAHAVQALTDYVVELGYAGLDVDLENVASSDRLALTSFVRQLSNSLHHQGKLITMAVPAKDHDVTTGWAGPYDYAALAPLVDLATIMSYEYSSPGGPPGPIAPYAWVDRVIAFAIGQFSGPRVLLGIPFYGYDWNVTHGGRARSLRYPQAEALARQYGVPIGFDVTSRSATFRYLAHPDDPLPPDNRPPPLDHEVRQRIPPPCPVPTPTRRPTPPPATPIPRAGQHVVWLENAQSSAARLEIASRLGAAGVGMWRLGQEDPAVWSTIASWRTTPSR